MENRDRSPLTAAVLSALVPGVGHLYAGRRRRGWALLGLTAVLVLPSLAIVIVVLGPWEMSGIRLATAVIRPFFDHPSLAVALLIVVIAAFAFRAFAVVDSYRVANGSRWPKAAGWLAIAALVGCLLLPHLWAADRALALHDLVRSDLVSDPAQAPIPESQPTLSSPTSAPSPPTQDSAPPQLAPTTVVTLAPPTTQVGPFGAKDRITVVLLGSDAGPGRSGTRTDTIIVASIDLLSGRTALFSIPRNQAQWPIPTGLPAASEWECACFPHATNTIYAYGLAHPELFPGGPNTGGNAVKAIIGEGLGIDIDYFAVVDLLGFVELVDLFGGIDIHVTKPVFDEGHEHPDGTTTDVWVPVGDHHFDGKDALAYVRVRRQDSDYHRMDRQRCVLEAMADQADPLTLILRFTKFADLIQEKLTTDIPVRQFPDFVDLLQLIDTDTIVTVRFMPFAPELAGTDRSYTAGTDGLGYWRPNVDLIRSTVSTILEAGPVDPLAELNLDSLQDVCEAG
jgi:LCP family protein required for cell wall assembly